MATPSTFPGSKSMAKAGPGVPPLTRVTAPERQASTTSTRVRAGEPARSSLSSPMSNRVSARWSEAASPWPEK